MAPFRKSGVSGDKELVAALRELAKGPTAQDIDEAALSSMQPMLRKTKERFKRTRDYVGKYPGFPQPKVPRKGGHVDEGIVVRKMKINSKSKRSYRLGATRRSRYLLHLVEFGTAPHFQPKFRGGWMHPGARATPVLIPTFDEEKGQVPAAFGRKLWSTMSLKISRVKKAPRRRK
jgi:hypothetical protein